MDIDLNPMLTELEVEYNVEFRGGEYDGLKFHFMKRPPVEWVLRDIKINGKKRLRHTEYCYHLVGIYIQLRHDPDEKPHYIEWDNGPLESVPCVHIYTLLPLTADELRQAYPEILVWHGREECGVVMLHAIYDHVH